MINLKKEDNLSNKTDSDIPEALLSLSKYGNLKYKNNKIYFKPITSKKSHHILLKLPYF